MKVCPQCVRDYDDRLDVCPSDAAPLINISRGSDPLLGKVLAGRFLIIEKLGQGGMGTVYKALHTKMDRICAIKLLNPSILNDESAMPRFHREAKLASRINDPHVVTIHDFGETEDGLLYLAMEYVNGQPLSRLLGQEGRLDPERVVHITCQIAEVLSAAHKLNMVHRDLKPDNVMITRKDNDPNYVKVLDFGIAKTDFDAAAGNITKTGYVMGTPLYMSPEQVIGEELDSRSDIYSLSLMVYEMLSGQLPFEGDNNHTMMMRRVISDPTPLRAVVPWINESIDRVVMSGLARDRQQRIQTAKELAFNIRETLGPGIKKENRISYKPLLHSAEPTTIMIDKQPTSVLSDNQVETVRAQRFSFPGLNRRKTISVWNRYTKVDIRLIALFIVLIAAPIMMMKMKQPPPQSPDDQIEKLSAPSEQSPSTSPPITAKEELTSTPDQNKAQPNTASPKPVSKSRQQASQPVGEKPANVGRDVPRANPPQSTDQPAVVTEKPASVASNNANPERKPEKKNGNISGFFKKIFGTPVKGENKNKRP